MKIPCRSETGRESEREREREREGERERERERQTERETESTLGCLTILTIRWRKAWP